MTTHCFVIGIIFILTTKIFDADFLQSKDKCGFCVKPEQCRLFREMDEVQKSKWLEQNTCFHTPGGEIDDNFKPLYGFSSTAKGDLVCCPGENVWGIEGSNTRKAETDPDIIDSNRKLDDDSEDPDTGRKPESDDPNLEQRFGFDDFRPNARRRFKHNNRRRSNNMYGNNNSDQIPFGGQNSYYPNQNEQNSCQNSLSLFPPEPRSKCCGMDVFSEKKSNQRQPPAPNPNWRRQEPPFWPRYSRSVQYQIPPPFDVNIDTRITGGFQTELEEYPWTAFIQTTFNFGQTSTTFNCGGSLISARYILTAGHCVSDSTALGISSVDVHLAEYDKRTYPEDCKYVQGVGRKCVTNIIIPADKIIPHPEFNEAALQNDIALIRISQNAPYTDFIRPVCLPTFSVDSPKFMDLRVAVAGWGREKQGEEISQLKQATVVNLIPYRNCVKYYPALTRNHICAAGKSGQDTCKGDSGGPLMMLYQNQYYIAGVVSGKRSDTKCGSRIPSLYTNVFYYIDWIKNNMREG